MRRGAVVIAALVCATPAASAKPPKKPRLPTVVSVETPLGLQGVAGAGWNVVVPFSLYDRRARPSDVEVEYGLDRNGDGRITDGTEEVPAGWYPDPDEYVPATEDRLDVRNTRTDRAPQLYASGRDGGSAQSYVWMSAADLPGVRLPFVEYKLDLNGRGVPDPDNPGSLLFATSPNGDPIFSGVKVRMRSRPRHGRPGPWVSTDAFALDNQFKPSMTIDALAEASDKPTTILVDWTIFHPASEDLNGNGALDLAQGEDRDGDGVLDSVRCVAAFDWHWLKPGEDPAKMTDAQLAALWWKPCRRDAAFGDIDELDARPGVPVPRSGPLAGLPAAPPGVGRHWVFAWDTDAEFGKTFATDGFILRATPADEMRNQGPTVYSTVVLHPG